LTFALIATSLAAHAADLPARPTYSPPSAIAVYNWTGIYLGINGGYGWGGQDPFSVINSQYD
jgi:outer membrane immunogenic protein